MQKLLSSKTNRILLAIVGTATLVIGASYTMVQQSTRLAADDLPLATAQTIKIQLENGAAPNDTVPAQSINLRGNNNTFAIVTDNTRHVLASSAVLDSQSPLPPSGVFDYTSAHGTDHFTWEPAINVRLATRVMTYSHGTESGYIITGQSLSQAEDRINTYSLLALAAWLAVIAWCFLILVLPERKLTRTK
jgi:hypothetical protein